MERVNNMKEGGKNQKEMLFMLGNETSGEDVMMGMK